MVCFVFFLWHASLRMLWICSFHFTRGKRFSFTASLHIFRFDYRFHVSCLSTSLLGVCPLLVVGALRLAFLRQIHFPQTANCSLFSEGHLMVTIIDAFDVLPFSPFLSFFDFLLTLCYHPE